MRYCKLFKIITAIWIIFLSITLVIFLHFINKTDDKLVKRVIHGWSDENFLTLYHQTERLTFHEAAGGNGRGGVIGSGDGNGVGRHKSISKYGGGSAVLGVDDIINKNSNNSLVVRQIINYNLENTRFVSSRMNNRKKESMFVSRTLRKGTPFLDKTKFLKDTKEKVRTNNIKGNTQYDYLRKDSIAISSTYSGWQSYLKYRADPVTSLWPKEDVETNDRVLNQIHYYKTIPKHAAKKVIYMATGMEGEEGQIRFLQHQCPVNWCTVTDDTKFEKSADLVYFKDFLDVKYQPTNSNQIHLLFMLESPMNTATYEINQRLNWTATYRRDSVINTPYERFTYFLNFTTIPEKPNTNYAYGKTKMVAWFVSNCQTRNGRIKYAKELAKYINVDIYGQCGRKSCIRHSGVCEKMLKERYKFYLSFENSNCKDYITEKFFTNALSNNVIPIVMGARYQDYERLAPPNSFIHVDQFQSPQNLAKYLKKLDQNDDLYNSYFRWKGAGEMIDTKFWCRLCHMLHARDDFDTRAWYSDVDEWWRGEGVCVYSDHVGWASWNRSKVFDISPSVTKRYHISHNKKRL